MDPGPSYSPNGGLFSATNQALAQLIAFAYKLDPIQLDDPMRSLPGWARSERFDIEARAQGNPTKDQMRLMMQSLLAERFKLALHGEAKQMPFYALELASAGKTGPKLRPYADDPPCPAATTPLRDFPPNTLEIPAALPCGQLQVQNISGHFRVIARGLSLPVLASYIGALARLDHPALDQTGLNGTFDLTIEYLPQPGQMDAPGVIPDAADSAAAPPLVTALKEQLGLKFERTAGPVDVLVIDHVEEPSPN